MKRPSRTRREAARRFLAKAGRMSRAGDAVGAWTMRDEANEMLRGRDS